MTYTAEVKNQNLNFTFVIVAVNQQSIENAAADIKATFPYLTANLKLVSIKKSNKRALKNAKPLTKRICGFDMPIENMYRK